MRTFVLVCVVAVLAALATAYFVGLVSIATEQTPDQCSITFTIDKAMIRHHLHSNVESVQPGGEAPEHLPPN